MKYLLAGAVLFLSACTQSPNAVVSDQCMRNALFQQCLAHVPAGPVATRYNDWDEVVSECGSQAYYQSLRRSQFVNPGCEVR